MTSQVQSKSTCQVNLPTQPSNTDERTDELTKNSKTSRDTSSSDTCARVQDFDDLKKRTAERKPEPARELRDPVEVINAHLEESA